MKLTIEIPENLAPFIRRAASYYGETLEEFAAEALGRTAGCILEDCGDDDGSRQPMEGHDGHDALCRTLSIDGPDCQSELAAALKGANSDAVTA